MSFAINMFYCHAYVQSQKIPYWYYMEELQFVKELN